MKRQQKRQKIVFVITKSNWGGAQRYVYDLATGLPREKFDITVALGGEGFLKKRLIASGVHAISVAPMERAVHFINDVKAFATLLVLIRDAEPDVLHLNSSKAGGLGSLAGRIARVPHIIFTVHGWAFNEELHPMWQTIRKFFSWLTVILCHTVILVSEYDRESARWMPWVQHKFRVIHNGSEKIAFTPKQEARVYLSSRVGIMIPHDVTWIGTISELHKNKGLEFVIHALGLLKKQGGRFVFFIIGEGSEKASLEALIASESLGEQIFLTNFIEDAHLFMGAFDIFTLTSVKEGLPYALLEAGAAGLPIIASAAGGIPEVIEDGETGLLATPKSPAAIAAGLKELIENPDLRSRLGQSLKTRVEKDFSKEKMMEETVALYPPG